MAASARPVDTTAPLAAHLVCFALAAILCALIIISGRLGYWPYVLGMALMASPGLMALVGTLITKRTLEDIFNPAHASWAMLADFALAAMLAIAADQYRSLPKPSFLTSLWWVLIAIAAGIGFALWFHFVMDAPAYRVPGGRELLSDPLKLIHNDISVFVLSSTSVALVTPVAVHGTWHSPALWVMAGCLALWIGGNIHDSAGLDIFRLHQAFDWANGRPLPRQN